MMLPTPKRSLMLILLFAFALDVVVAKFNSQTMDEADHLHYGVKVLHANPDRDSLYLDSKTPITALNALPRVVAEHVESFPWLRKQLSSLVRLASILSALVVIVVIYRLAYEFYGSTAALAAALLAALSPNLIAHGTLVTTDGYFAAGVVTSVYFFRRFLLDATPRNAFAAGLAIAIAQLAKPMSIYLYLLVGIFLLLPVLVNTHKRLPWKKALMFVAIVVGSTVAVLNVAYSFDRTFTTLRAYQFEGSVLRDLQSTSVLGGLPVIVPYPVLQGFDKLLNPELMNSTYGNVYLLGQLRRVADPTFHGFKSYYFVAWFFKEPIALQILFLWGVVYILRNRKGILFNEGLVFAAGGILVSWLSFFSKAQIGIRHTLPALALEIVIAAAPFATFTGASRLRRVVLSGLVIWLAVSMFSYYPSMIPYMNEWVTDRRLSYRVLADSNLDWGQDMGVVQRFLKRNPDVVLDPDEPVSRRVLVSADRLVGIVPKDKGPLTWALKYQPVAQVGYAHFLFELPEEAVKRP